MVCDQGVSTLPASGLSRRRTRMPESSPQAIWVMVFFWEVAS